MRKPALRPVVALLAGTAVMLGFGLAPASTSADANVHPKHKREGCHNHMHRHGRDLAHRHPHCHHHEHDRGRHGDDRGHGRDNGRHDDYTGYDGDHGRYDDRDYDDHRRAQPAPPPPPPAPAVRPPTPPAPWEVARQFGVRVDFNKSDKYQIDRYFRKTRRKAEISGPPHLPPGTEHKIKKGVILPPGIHIRGVPSGLESRLGKLPSGHRYGVMGKLIIIYDKHTRIVKDTEKAF